RSDPDDDPTGDDYVDVYGVEFDPFSISPLIFSKHVFFRQGKQVSLTRGHILSSLPADCCLPPPTGMQRKKVRGTPAMLVALMSVLHSDMASQNAVAYAKFYSRSHDAVIRVYDAAGNVIETHQHTGDFKRVLGDQRACE